MFASDSCLTPEDLLQTDTMIPWEEDDNFDIWLLLYGQLCSYKEWKIFFQPGEQEKVGYLDLWEEDL
jgi:hypothetical protein